MNKKQELIEYVIGNEFITKPSLQDQFNELLDEAIAEQLILHGVINWVACDKKLPKRTGDILIYVDGLGVRNAIFNINDNSFSFNSVYKPTHWAELPKPPCL